MKFAIAALVLVLLCPTRGIADDEPKKPKLDESLKELEWLVGYWEVKSHDDAVHASKRDESHGLIYGHDRSDSAMILPGLFIVRKADRRSLTISYRLAFRIYPFVPISVKETIVHDAESGSFMGEYTWKPTDPRWDVNTAGGHYSLKKTNDDSWTGNATSTYVPSPPRSANPTQKSGHYSIELTKHDNDSFSVALTNRVDCPHGPKEITVHFIRKQKKQE